MPLIPKVEPKQEKKIVTARLDEETHAMLQRYAVFVGNASHDYIITESLKRLFRKDREFKEWLDENHPNGTAGSPRSVTAEKHPTAKAAAKE